MYVSHRQGLRIQSGLNFFILDSRRAMPQARKVLPKWRQHTDTDPIAMSHLKSVCWRHFGERTSMLYVCDERTNKNKTPPKKGLAANTGTVALSGVYRAGTVECTCAHHQTPKTSALSCTYSNVTQHTPTTEPACVQSRTTSRRFDAIWACRKTFSTQAKVHNFSEMIDCLKSGRK